MITYANALWRSQSMSNCANGKKAGSDKKGRPKTRITDEQCLEARARNEFFGWDEYRLADCYGVNVEYMVQVLECVSRIHLIHKPEHANLKEH